MALLKTKNPSILLQRRRMILKYKTRQQWWKTQLSQMMMLQKKQPQVIKLKIQLLQMIKRNNQMQGLVEEEDFKLLQKLMHHLVQIKKLKLKVLEMILKRIKEPKKALQTTQKTKWLKTKKQKTPQLFMIIVIQPYPLTKLQCALSVSKDASEHNVI